MGRKRKAPVDDGYVPATITFTEDKRVGRPPYNWPQINPVLRFYIRAKSSGIANIPKQETFIEWVRAWCKQEGWGVPRRSTIEQRIQRMQREIFASD